MPELPEVETVRRQLHERLKGCAIVDVEIWKRGREFPSGAAFVSAVMGRQIQAIERRAKLLIWKFTDDSALTAHLKMTGRFVFVEPGYERGKHDRIRFVFQSPFDERQQLVWSDVRQFGFVRVLSKKDLATALEEYGPEPLETSAESLTEMLPKNSRRSIKAALLDQGVIAGVGNIYADESCFRARILPTRSVTSLSPADRLRLMQAVKSVLSDSLKQRGTSANDYVDTQGERGGFLGLLNVYGRDGEACVTCKAPIKKIVLVQRGTHFCPKCQH